MSDDFADLDVSGLDQAAFKELRDKFQGDTTFNQAFDEVAVDSDEIIQLLKDSTEALLHFFIGDQLIFDVPEVHLESAALMKDYEFAKEAWLALALPRGHAKTTLLKVLIVWYFLFTYMGFIIYVAASLTHAKNACADIWEMMNSDNFVAVFGRPIVEKISSNEGLYIFTIPLFNKRCILRALGAGQKLRGLNINNLRPQLAAVDDLEDYDSLESETMQKSLRRWFYGTFMKALDLRKNTVIMIGNMLSNNSLLKECCDSPRWRSRVYGSLLETGEPLWGDLWTIERLAADLQAYKANGDLGLWMAEMMNNPVKAQGNLIEANEIPFAPMIGYNRLRYSFITVDPAFSKKSVADNSAIVVHGLETDYWMPIDHFLGKVNPLEMLEIIVNFCKTYGTRIVGIESGALQGALLPMFEHVLHKQGDFGIEFVPLSSEGKQKQVRLRAWAALLKNGDYKLPMDDVYITKQLLAYDVAVEKNDDDLIDSCAYGVHMQAQYMPQIMSAGVQKAMQRANLLGSKVETV